MPWASVWHGDAAQALELQVVIAHNCGCDHDAAGRISGKCGAHRALLDQRFCDGLLFARYLSGELIREEFATANLQG